MLSSCEEPAKLNLQWDRPQECRFITCYYKISRNNCNQDNVEIIAKVGQPSYIDRDVERGHCYSYQVRACYNYSDQCSKASTISITVPKIKGPLIYQQNPEDIPNELPVHDIPLLKV